MENRQTPVPAQPPGDWHLREVDEVTQAHDVDPLRGLQASQVNERTLKFGANALPAADDRSLWSLVLEQFNDFMILVLLAAAVISGPPNALEISRKEFLLFEGRDPEEIAVEIVSGLLMGEFS